MALLDFCNNGIEFFTTGLEDLVVVILPLVRFVIGDGEHVESVNILKFSSFSFSGPGHAAEFFIKSKIILNRDCSVSLGFALDFHIFFCFDRLVKPIRPTASGHFASGIFVDNDYLAILDNILVVFLIQTISFQKLRNGVNSGALSIHFGLDSVLFGEALFIVQIGVGIDIGEVRGKVRYDESFGIFR